VSHLLLSEQYLPLKGGHIVLLHELASRLGQVNVLSGIVKGAPPAERIDGVAVARINLNRHRFLRPESLALYAKLVAHGAKLVQSERPRAVLGARALPEGLVAVALSRLYRVPSVVFAHGEEVSMWMPTAPSRQQRRITAALKRKLLWTTYRNATLIVAVSRFTRDLLLSGGINRAKVSVVHPGTDPERYRPMPRDLDLAARLGIDGAKVILTVGRLTSRKGQDLVLKSLPQILQAVGSVVYLVVGSGPYESDLRQLARRSGVEQNVRFLGEVPWEMLPRLYNLTDLFVMPNRVSATGDLEGFGIVFLEAGACEIPVVGGRSGGVPDAIADGETGILVDGDSPSEVASAVIGVLKDDTLARRLGKNARARVCRDFTWDHAANRLKELIHHLDQTGRSAGRPRALRCDARRGQSVSERRGSGATRRDPVRGASKSD
jgi:phosphatidylinositol alpha-1,6-mannosyltransferase